MAVEPKRWKTEIWLDDKVAEPVVVYGETLEKLQVAAKNWLTENKPLLFNNAPPTYSLPERIKHYFYSDGTRTIPILSIYSAHETETLPEGWYWTEGCALYPRPRPLQDVECAVAHFIEEAMIPEAGPDYAEGDAEPEGGYLMRMMAHPATLGAVIGVLSSICYVAVPITGGYDTHFLLATDAVFRVMVFTFFMTILFAIIGLVLFKGLALLEIFQKKRG